MNPRVALPPKARASLYLPFALIGVALGATQVGYSAAEAGQPTWLIVAMSVYAFLGGALGITAASNTDTSAGSIDPAYGPMTTDQVLVPDEDDGPDDGDVDLPDPDDDLDGWIEVDADAADPDDDLEAMVTATRVD